MCCEKMATAKKLKDDATSSGPITTFGPSVVKGKFEGFFKVRHGKPLYGVQFCHYMKPNDPIKFAVVGSNNIAIYECLPDDVILIQSYTDPSPNETFYNCCWSYDPKTFEIIIAAGGFTGLIRIIHPIKMTGSKCLTGHFGSINDLKFHPRYPSVLLSASKDQTCRLWNIQTNVCIGIFGGKNGHNGQVMSVDFDSMGNRIVSCGMDNFIFIWHIDKKLIKEGIEASFSVIESEKGYLFRTLTQEYPDFSSRDVHNNMVDCGKWLNNLILSKSLHNYITCWTPVMTRESYVQPNSFTQIDRFDVSDCDVWYTRFSMNPSMKYMAIGNRKGETFVWSMQSEKPTQHVVLKHPKCVAAIRQTAFSRDGKILICVCVDSTVWRWDISSDFK